jgi:hypothetical protein
MTLLGPELALGIANVLQEKQLRTVLTIIIIVPGKIRQIIDMVSLL